MWDSRAIAGSILADGAVFTWVTGQLVGKLDIEKTAARRAGPTSCLRVIRPEHAIVVENVDKRCATSAIILPSGG
jgi:glycerol-3-phosphate acyltransferase PlsY